MPNVIDLDFKGKKILQTTFPKGSKLPAVLEVLGETRTHYGNYIAGEILTMFVFQNLDCVDDAFVNQFELIAKNSLSLIKATAFVGFTPEQKGLFNAMISITGVKAQLFDTVEAAKEWLATAGTPEDDMFGF